MKPEQLITSTNLTKSSRHSNILLCNMDVEVCNVNPIPIVEIKDEDDCIIQMRMTLPRRSTDEDRINQWDAKISKHIKSNLVICNSEKDFEDVLEEYVRSLEKEAVYFKKKTMLKAKILFHLSFFHLMFCCLSKKLVGICTTNYLDYIEKILLIYCNLELQAVRNWKVNQIGGEHAIAKKVAQKLINTLCVNLMNDQKRVFHILLRLNHDHELHCKEIMNIVYKHFLISHPVKDSSDLSYCRYYLLFEKWKSLNDKKDHEALDNILLFIFKKKSPESLEKSAVFKEIWSSSSNSLINVVDALLNGPQTFIKKYFHYISKLCEDDEVHIPQTIDSEEEDDSPRVLFDLTNKEKISNDSVKSEETVPKQTQQQRMEISLNNEDVICVIDDDSDIEEVTIETSKMLTKRTPCFTSHLRISFMDTSSTLDEMSPSRSPSPEIPNEEAVLPMLSSFIESVRKSAENSSVQTTDSCNGLEESLERTSLVDNAGAPSEVNSVSESNKSTENVNMEETQIDDNSRTESRNNSIIEMHVESTSGSNNQCSYCCARLANGCNNNPKSVETSSGESKKSVDYFCGMDTPPSDRTAEENSPTIEISLENDSSKLYSYVPEIISSGEELYIETNYENQDLQISETPPSDPQNTKETEVENANSQKVQEENVNVEEESLVTVQEPIDTQEQLNEIEINTQESASVNELNETPISSIDTASVNQQEVHDSEMDEDEIPAEDIQTQTETALENFEKSVNENELNEISENSVDETEIDVTNIDDIEESFDDNLDRTPLSIDEEEPSEEVVCTKSTAKQIIEMVKETELQEKAVSVSEVSVIVNAPENERTQKQAPDFQQQKQTPDFQQQKQTSDIQQQKQTPDFQQQKQTPDFPQQKQTPDFPQQKQTPDFPQQKQTPDFQQHIYNISNTNSHDANARYQIISPLNENQIARVTDASEEYQIVKSVRESCAALHQNNYCLNNITTSSTTLSSIVPPLVATSASQNLGHGIIPLVLSSNLIADRQEIVYPIKDNSPKIIFTSTSVKTHTNKYIYTPPPPPPPVSTHLHASTPSILNPIMNNSLSEFENFHQKHNELILDPNTTNGIQARKIQASVTMQPLVESTKKTNGILKTSKRGASHNRIYYPEGEKSRSYPGDWFEEFQQSKREFIESASGPVNSLITNKLDYLNYDDPNITDNFSLYNNVQLNNSRERCSPVSPAYEQIQANDYKNHILKVSMENSILKSENILRKKLSTRNSNQIYNFESMQSSKNGLNNSRINELLMPYKSSLSSKGGLKRQYTSDQPNKKPKITFNTHVETHMLPREEDHLLMTNYMKDYSFNKSTNKTQTRKYPSLTPENLSKINIVTTESMEVYNVSSNDRKLFADVPCVEVKLDTTSEIRQKMDQQTLKSKLDSVMKRKKLESENTCIQTRIDYIKPEESSVVFNRHTENVTPPYPGFFGFPGTNFLGGYSSTSVPSGFTDPASAHSVSSLPGLKRNQLTKESTEDSRNNNTDSHLTVKTRRCSINEGNEVNVVNSHFSKNTRRRNNATKSPIVEATKRRGRPKKTETTKSPTSKTSTGVLYSDGPFRLA